MIIYVECNGYELAHQRKSPNVLKYFSAFFFIFEKVRENSTIRKIKVNATIRSRFKRLFVITEKNVHFEYQQKHDPVLKYCGEATH